MKNSQTMWRKSNKSRYETTLYSPKYAGKSIWGRRIQSNVAILPMDSCPHQFIVEIYEEKKCCVGTDDSDKESSLLKLIKIFPNEKLELEKLSSKLREKYIKYEVTDAVIHCLGMPDLDAHSAFGAIFYKGNFVKGFTAADYNSPIRNLKMLKQKINKYFMSDVDFEALERVFQSRSLPSIFRNAVKGFF